MPVLSWSHSDDDASACATGLLGDDHDCARCYGCHHDAFGAERSAVQIAGLVGADDMIVVGTHKTGYLHGRSLGTKSIVVASIAPCTVVVVPEETSSTRRGVVIGVAPGEYWHDAVRVGAREAAALRQDRSAAASRAPTRTASCQYSPGATPMTTPRRVLLVSSGTTTTVHGAMDATTMLLVPSDRPCK